MKKRRMMIFASVLLSAITLATAQQRGLYVPDEQGQTHPVSDERRIALVIGNRDYNSLKWGRLRNPINDAAAMETALKAVGFSVTRLDNGTRSQMLQVVNQFATQVVGNHTVALMFYAGHGVEAEGVNYLVPVDDASTCRNEIEVNCVSLDYVHKKLKQAGTAFNILVSDACRNNGLPFSCPAAKRDADKMGFAEFRAKGSFIAYSTAPGTTALDGEGLSNSPYTSALVKALAQIGLPIESVFKKVSQSLASVGQEPWWSGGNFTGEFYFHPASEQPTPPQKTTNVPVLRLPCYGLSIGNSNYEHIFKLKSPTDDARIVSELWKQSGISVSTLLNATNSAMSTSLTQLKEKAQKNPNSIRLFYFSGHGHKGKQKTGFENVLLSIDNKLNNASQTSYVFLFDFSLEDVLKSLDVGNGYNVVIIDTDISNTNNLNISNLKTPTFLITSAAFNQSPDDGQNGMSPFVEGLRQYWGQPNWSLQQIFQETAKKVREIRPKQQPQLITNYYNEIILSSIDGGLPEQFSLKAYCPTPNNQGSSGSAVGQACGYSAMTIFKAAQEELTDTKKITTTAFSGLYPYLLVSSGNRGASFKDAIEVLSQHGNLLYQDFDSKSPDCDKQLVNPTPLDVMYVPRFEELYKSSDLNEIKKTKLQKAIASKQPVVVGIGVGDAFFRFQGTPDYFSTASNQSNGNHAVVVIGYDQTGVEILNSWGTNWGNQGFCKISYETFWNMCAVGYSLVSVEKRYSR